MGSPYLATAAMPATCSSQLISAPAASSSRTVARVIDGPIPSPGISVTFVDMLSSSTHNEIHESCRQYSPEDAGIRARGIALHLSDPAGLREARVNEGETQCRASRTVRILGAIEAKLDRREHDTRVLVEGDRRPELRRERLGETRPGNERRRAQWLFGERIGIARVGRVALVAGRKISGQHPATRQAALGERRGDVVVHCTQQIAAAAAARA